MELFSLPEYNEATGKWTITVLDFARLQSELQIEFPSRQEAWKFYNKAIKSSIESAHDVPRQRRTGYPS